MNAHMHHRCWRHRAQVRSAEAGICKVERFTATDLAISLQFRWDYFQDILIYYKCHVHTDTCDVYIIHVLCHSNIRCLYSYIYIYHILYIYAWHQRRVPRIPRSQVLVGNHSQLCVFFQETIFRSINKKGPLCWVVLFTPPKTNMSFENLGSLEDYWPLFRGHVSFRGVQYALYTHGPAHIGWFSHS